MKFRLTQKDQEDKTVSFRDFTQMVDEWNGRFPPDSEFLFRRLHVDIPREANPVKTPQHIVMRRARRNRLEFFPESARVLRLMSDHPMIVPPNSLHQHSWLEAFLQQNRGVAVLHLPHGRGNSNPQVILVERKKVWEVIFDLAMDYLATMRPGPKFKEKAKKKKFENGAIRLQPFFHTAVHLFDQYRIRIDGGFYGREGMATLSEGWSSVAPLCTFEFEDFTMPRQMTSEPFAALAHMANPSVFVLTCYIALGLYIGKVSAEWEFHHFFEHVMAQFGAVRLTAEPPLEDYVQRHATLARAAHRYFFLEAPQPVEPQGLPAPDEKWLLMLMEKALVEARRIFFALVKCKVSAQGTLARERKQALPHLTSLVRVDEKLLIIKPVDAMEALFEQACINTDRLTLSEGAGVMDFCEQLVEGCKSPTGEAVMPFTHPHIILAGAGQVRTTIRKCSAMMLSMEGNPATLLCPQLSNVLVPLGPHATLLRTWPSAMPVLRGMALGHMFMTNYNSPGYETAPEVLWESPSVADDLAFLVGSPFTGWGVHPGEEGAPAFEDTRQQRAEVMLRKMRCVSAVWAMVQLSPVPAPYRKNGLPTQSCFDVGNFRLVRRVFACLPLIALGWKACEEFRRPDFGSRPYSDKELLSNRSPILGLFTKACSVLYAQFRASLRCGTREELLRANSSAWRCASAFQMACSWGILTQLDGIDIEADVAQQVFVDQVEIAAHFPELVSAVVNALRAAADRKQAKIRENSPLLAEALTACASEEEAGAVRRRFHAEEEEAGAWIVLSKKKTLAQLRLWLMHEGISVYMQTVVWLAMRFHGIEKTPPRPVVKNLRHDIDDADYDLPESYHVFVRREEVENEDDRHLLAQLWDITRSRKNGNYETFLRMLCRIFEFTRASCCMHFDEEEKRCRPQCAGWIIPKYASATADLVISGVSHTGRVMTQANTFLVLPDQINAEVIIPAMRKKFPNPVLLTELELYHQQIMDAICSIMTAVHERKVKVKRGTVSHDFKKPRNPYVGRDRVLNRRRITRRKRRAMEEERVATGGEPSGDEEPSRVSGYFSKALSAEDQAIFEETEKELDEERDAMTAKAYENIRKALNGQVY